MKKKELSQKMTTCTNVEKLLDSGIYIFKNKSAIIDNIFLSYRHIPFKASRAEAQTNYGCLLYEDQLIII